MWICVILNICICTYIFKCQLYNITKLTVKHLSTVQETQVLSLGGEDLLEKEMATHSSILAWKNPMDGRAWWATVHGVAKSRTRLSDFIFTLWNLSSLAGDWTQGCSSKIVVPWPCSEVTQSCSTLCNPMDCRLPGSSVHGIFPGKNTGVGCHFLLQGIVLTQGSNPGLLHCRKTLYHLSHEGIPGPREYPWFHLFPRKQLHTHG